MPIEVSPVINETVATALATNAKVVMEGVATAHNLLYQNQVNIQNAQAQSLIAMTNKSNENMLNRDPLESMGGLVSSMQGVKAGQTTPPVYSENRNTTQG